MNELYANGIPNVNQGSLWTPFENYVPRNLFDIVGKKCELAKKSFSLQKASGAVRFFNPAKA